MNIFSDPAVQALQFLDVISMKDPSQKAQFFRITLTQVFPFIPRVRNFNVSLGKFQLFFTFYYRNYGSNTLGLY